MKLITLIYCKNFKLLIFCSILLFSGKPILGSTITINNTEIALLIGPGKKKQFKKSKKTFKKNKYPDHSYTKRAGGRRKTVNIKSNRSKIERRTKKQKKRITKKSNRYDKKIGKFRD